MVLCKKNLKSPPLPPSRFLRIMLTPTRLKGSECTLSLVFRNAVIKEVLASHEVPCLLDLSQHSFAWAVRVQCTVAVCCCCSFSWARCSRRVVNGGGARVPTTWNNIRIAPITRTRWAKPHARVVSARTQTAMFFFQTSFSTRCCSITNPLVTQIRKLKGKRLFFLLRTRETWLRICK